MISLEQYLKERIVPSTTKRYLQEIAFFCTSLEAKGINPIAATYSQIMDYLGVLRAKKKGIRINCSLSAIKKYYSYLLAANLRQDHPCKYIKLRDKKSRDIQLQDLFREEELELLLERKERYPLLKNRNRIIISLLIYQGLRKGEIANLEVENIDLEEGIIEIKSRGKGKGRSLKLHSKQVFWFMKYLQEDREKLLLKNKKKRVLETDLERILLISSRGTAENEEGIGYLIETQRHLFPDKKLNTITIRQSVITNLLKQGKDLRLVQVFAGHKTPSTTEKYKQTEVEELRNQIFKYHPLG